jgi:hypothetical protein
VSIRVSKTELTEEASLLERLLSEPDPLTWFDNRKLQLELMKFAEERKKAIAGDKVPLSPLGQRPPLDADHVPLPKGRVRYHCKCTCLQGQSG